MLLNILQLIFCAIPIALSLTLYKSRRRFMARFYMAMTRSAKARKLYTQVLLILLLLFHYIHASVHTGEFGILLSTGICAAMFSFKLVDRWLRCLLDRPRALAIFTLATLVMFILTGLFIGLVPYLYTTTVTATYLLLAALFYPSARVLAEWSNENKIAEWVEHPERLAESYHDNHHAKLPHEADSGNESNTSAL